MLLVKKDYVISIDVDATKKYYDQESKYECSCAGCTNFMQAIDSIPIKIVERLKQMGVEVSKLMRVNALVKKDDGVLYDCIFRVVGTMESKALPQKEDDDYSDFCFHDKDMWWYPCENFPEPNIEGMFVVTLPWLLQKECEY